jgi:hypothetical protein
MTTRLILHQKANLLHTNPANKMIYAIILTKPYVAFYEYSINPFHFLIQKVELAIDFI